MDNIFKDIRDIKTSELSVRCYNCQGTDIKIIWESVYGKEPGFCAGRIMCNTCKLSYGNLCGNGTYPLYEDAIRLINEWNNLKIKHK